MSAPVFALLDFAAWLVWLCCLAAFLSSGTLGTLSLAYYAGCCTFRWLAPWWTRRRRWLTAHCLLLSVAIEQALLRERGRRLESAARAAELRARRFERHLRRANAVAAHRFADPTS